MKLPDPNPPNGLVRNGPANLSGWAVDSSGMQRVFIEADLHVSSVSGCNEGAAASLSTSQERTNGHKRSQHFSSLAV